MLGPWGCPFPLPLPQVSLWSGQGQGILGSVRTGEAPRYSPYQAHDAPVHPDLTVALANPIKFFSAHDKKSVKLKEAMGGLPEVCVAGSIARGPQEICPLCGKMREGQSPGLRERGLSEPSSSLLFLHRSPSPLGVQLPTRPTEQLPGPAMGQRVCTARSSHLLGRVLPSLAASIGTSQPSDL